MVTALAARWLLTALFAAAGLGILPLRRQAASAQLAHRVSAAFHVLMCAALIAMTWRSEPAAAVWLQTALFGSAVVWFGLASPDRRARLRAGRLAGLHHALMAAAMIWMITAMPAAMHMGPGPGQTTSSMSHPAIPAVVPGISVLLAAYFAFAAVPWLARAIGSGRPANNNNAVGHAAMSAGMAAMLLAMS